MRQAILFGALIFSGNFLAGEPQVVEDPDAILAKIRAKMAEHLSQLPNYTCHEVIQRYAKPLSSGSLDRQDTVELEVAFVGRRELFARSEAAKFEEQSISKMVTSGTIGNGVFGIHADAVFSGDAATFKYVGITKKEGHKTFRYDFTVPQEKSRFLVRHNSAEGIVGYKGSFWADADTLDLVRFELKADHMPSYLDLSLVHEIMHYKLVRIRDADFLLASKSEHVAIEGSGFYYLNTIDLERCREFKGESVVTFGAPGDVPSAAPAATDR